MPFWTAHIVHDQVDVGDLVTVGGDQGRVVELFMEPWGVTMRRGIHDAFSLSDRHHVKMVRIDVAGATWVCPLAAIYGGTAVLSVRDDAWHNIYRLRDNR